MAKVKEMVTKAYADEDEERQSQSLMAVGTRNDTALENSVAVSLETNIPQNNHTTAFMGIYPREIKINVHTAS